MKKRLIKCFSILCALTMLLSVLPGAFAEEEAETILNDASQDEVEVPASGEPAGEAPAPDAAAEEILAPAAAEETASAATEEEEPAQEPAATEEEVSAPAATEEETPAPAADEEEQREPAAEEESADPVTAEEEAPASAETEEEQQLPAAEEEQPAPDAEKEEFPESAGDEEMIPAPEAAGEEEADSVEAEEADGDHSAEDPDQVMLDEGYVQVMVIRANGTNLYRTKDADAEAVAQLKHGEAVWIKAVGGMWGEIKVILDGREETLYFNLNNVMLLKGEIEYNIPIRKVRLTSTLDGRTEIEEGTLITITAEFSGFTEDEIADITWQYRPENDEEGVFTDIAGAHEFVYTYFVSAENIHNEWRIVLTLKS